MPLLIAFFVALCSLVWLATKKRSDKKKLPPEVGQSWPFLGHLHLLRSSRPTHRVLGEIADKCGPIFTIKLGRQLVVVVNNWETAKECFTTNDRSFASRPDLVFSCLLGFENCNFGFAPYGDFWRQLRKIVTIDLLSNNRLSTFKELRETEIRIASRELRKFWEQHRDSSNKAMVDIKSWIRDITLNFIMKIVLGKATGYATGDDAGVKIADWKVYTAEFSALSGKIMIADALPLLRWLDIGNEEKTIKSAVKKVDSILNAWLMEHKEKANMENGDFMHLLIKILEKSKVNLEGRDPDSVLKATCLGLVLAASDTTVITMTWAFASLLTHPQKLKKVQEEIDAHVGRERTVRESDTKNFVYLKAVVKETLRLFPAVPLLLHHFSVEDCTVAGYHIPANTILIPNVWKIHRDPQVWENPSEFSPERFIESRKDVDVRGQNFELIPFGSGRRMCPGINFAFQVIELTMASLLHEFDFVPCGAIDWTESVGMTALMPPPLNIYVTPRLP